MAAPRPSRLNSRALVILAEYFEAVLGFARRPAYRECVTRFERQPERLDLLGVGPCIGIHGLSRSEPPLDGAFLSVGHCQAGEGLQRREPNRQGLYAPVTCADQFRGLPGIATGS